MSVTRYVVSRDKFWYWAGGNKWATDPIGARWFATFDEAKNAGYRELPDPADRWTVQPLNAALQPEAHR